MSNSVPQHQYLSHLTDAQILDGVAKHRAKMIDRAFPGAKVEAVSYDEAMAEGGANFEVEMHPLMVINSPKGLEDEGAAISPVATHCATVRTDTMTTLGIVGSDYGIVQTPVAMQALKVLADRGDVRIVKVENVNSGARVRVTALIGESNLTQLNGTVDTLCHFGIFEATHDGSASTTASLYTLRVACFNGMTSRSKIGVHRLRHTSKVSDRTESFAQAILADLIGDAAAELEIFKLLATQKMDRLAFNLFATDFLNECNGTIRLEDEGDKKASSKGKQTRRENEMNELEAYFWGGNQGAGETAYGAYNSVTRWIEGKREALSDAKAAARKYTSNIQGDGQRKVARALRMLIK